MLRGQRDGLLAVAGLPHDVVALLAEHLGEVEPDQGLVLGHDDAGAGRGRGGGRRSVGCSRGGRADAGLGLGTAGGFTASSVTGTV